MQQKNKQLKSHWTAQPISFCHVRAQSLQRLYKYGLLRMQAVWGQSLLPKKTA